MYCPLFLSDLTKIVTWRYIRILIKSKRGILWKFHGWLFEFLQTDRQVWRTYKRHFGTFPRERTIKYIVSTLKFPPSTAALSRNEPASSADMPWHLPCSGTVFELYIYCHCVISFVRIFRVADCYMGYVICAWVHIYTMGYGVAALISLGSINGITAGGPAVVIEICLLWRGLYSWKSWT